MLLPFFSNSTMLHNSTHVKLQIGGKEVEISTSEILQLMNTLEELQQSTQTKTTHDDAETRSSLLIENLGWTQSEIKEAYARLLSFQEDWNAPGMEGYDDL